MMAKRKILLFIFLMCAGAITVALYAQYVQWVAPCPLCIAQRVIIGIVGILALLFAIHNPKSFLIRIYGIILAGFSIFGIKVAARHVWLIHLTPDQEPTSCGMPLEVLYKRIPLNNFIGYILRGDGECSKVTWTIFGINAPTAVIILLIIITLLSLYIIFAKTNKTERRFF
ncbi:MAG: disulfide bond formation protein B [Burkholderiales bacterium]|nr:disulfide bond formation protein B [Burkholderiales bacterium]